MNSGGAMAEQRLHKRLDCEEKCILSLRGLHYFATVKNISLGGALVRFNTSQPGLYIGDNCSISMNRGSLSEYPSEVVRVENPNIALMFTDFH